MPESGRMGWFRKPVGYGPVGSNPTLSVLENKMILVSGDDIGSLIDDNGETIAKIFDKVEIIDD